MKQKKASKKAKRHTQAFNRDQSSLLDMGEDDIDNDFDTVEEDEDICVDDFQD